MIRQEPWVASRAPFQNMEATWFVRHYGAPSFVKDSADKKSPKRIGTALDSAMAAVAARKYLRSHPALVDTL